MAIANAVVEALAKVRIPGEAGQVLFCILRKTYGWKKKTDAISLSQFVEATGMKKNHIIDSIHKLERMNMIVIEKDNQGCPENGTGGVPKKGTLTTRYGLNKDFESWLPLPKKVTLPKKVMIVTEKGNETLPNSGHTKENKTTIQKKKESASLKIDFSTPENIPSEIRTAEMISAWKEWVHYRQEAKRPIKSELTVAKAMQVLVKMGTQKAIQSINQSIANGWQGLFEPKTGTSGKKELTYDEKVQKQIEELKGMQ